MDKEFLTFQKFYDKDDALAFAELLRENNITCLIDDNSMVFEGTFAYNPLDKEFIIKLQKKDFEKADDILLQISSTELDEVAPDYYLLSFTDQKLMEILMNNDAWSRFDFLLAQKILKQRGKEVNPDIISLLKNQRIQELAKPEPSQKGMLSAGYIFAVLGSLFGIFIAWHLLTYKKTLPNGERVYVYSETDRKNARIMLIIAIVLIIFWIIVALITNFSSI